MEKSGDVNGKYFRAGKFGDKVSAGAASEGSSAGTKLRKVTQCKPNDGDYRKVI